jgi:TPR repeat protein
MSKSIYRALAALAVVWTVAAAAAPAEDAMAEAIGQYARGETEAARRAFEALSRQGVPAADYNLALMHLNGDLPGGAAAAQVLMRRAADAGFVTAMHGLGLLYEQGRLGPPDLPQAVAWFLRAAHGGHVDAQVAAGTAYYLGRGIAPDMAQAAQWYREAAKGGDVGAQYLIASMYETGLGVERDLRLARYWYDIAARNGDEAAPAKVQELDERIRNQRDCQAPAGAPTAPPSPSGAC